ncbi:hypothetical protein [Pollutibacter soli]|uniref:hypothetical protein n=1 Tax=Pollutibacter soli TaxID=3034157 RepID=UPI003013454E
MTTKKSTEGRTGRRQPARKNKSNWIEKFINSSNITDFETGLFRKVDFENIASWLKKGTSEAKAQRDRFFSMLCNVEYLY